MHYSILNVSICMEDSIRMKMVNYSIFFLSGHSSQTYMENAIELVRIIRHFVTEMPEEMDIFTETVSLLEVQSHDTIFTF